ncbi:MAG: SGNH hydrolase-type esterase domain-containing protein [Monoraphidium minutum]|nr:MAG: SGNH hydrolase-type esterase domain-containing protein [Monoraphidium minutum]
MCSELRCSTDAAKAPLRVGGILAGRNAHLIGGCRHGPGSVVNGNPRFIDSMATGVARRSAVALIILVGSLCWGGAQAAKCGPLRLLAIGDSITKGSTPSLGRDLPYASLLREQLQSAVPCFDVETTVAAVGGAGVLKANNGQTVLDVGYPALRSGDWDWAIIMVGINDLLALGKSAREVWDGGLKDLYDEVLARGARVAALMPLPTALIGSDDNKDRERRELGKLIYGYSKKRPGVYPLYYGIEWNDEQKGKWLDNDKLHLSEEGHRELARQVFMVLRMIMGRDPCASCTKYVNDAPPPADTNGNNARPQNAANAGGNAANAGGNGANAGGGGGNGNNVRGSGRPYVPAVPYVPPATNAAPLLNPGQNFAGVPGFGGIQFPGMGGFGFGGLQYGAADLNAPGVPTGGGTNVIMRYRQCGGEGAECPRYGQAYCVDAPWPATACFSSLCQRVTQWVWTCM